MALLHSDFPFILVDQKGICDVCIWENIGIYCIKEVLLKLSNLLTSIIFYILGLIVVKSINGFSYFLIAVDNCSKYTWVTLMKPKYETR